jgi:hypothetical protein
MIAALRSVIQAVGFRHCPASRKKTKANFSCRADPEIGIWRKDALSPLSYSHDFHDRLWRRKGSPRPNGKAR